MKDSAKIALLLSLGAMRLDRQLSELEKQALREKCKSADILELGHLLHQAHSSVEQEIIMEEIQRRGL